MLSMFVIFSLVGKKGNGKQYSIIAKKCTCNAMIKWLIKVSSLSCKLFLQTDRKIDGTVFFVLYEGVF